MFVNGYLDVYRMVRDAIMDLKKRILNCLNECGSITRYQLWQRFYNVRGHKIDFAVEDLQFENIVMNLSVPGYPIGLHDYFRQGLHF